MGLFKTALSHNITTQNLTNSKGSQNYPVLQRPEVFSTTAVVSLRSPVHLKTQYVRTWCEIKSNNILTYDTSSVTVL